MKKLSRSKGFKVTPNGQWEFPGENTLIPSNQITMKGVPYPVFGMDNTGYSQMMYPGMEYTYPGSMVYEIPMAQEGGTFNPDTDEFIGFVDELPQAQEGLEKKGFDALTESQKALLQKGNNLDKVKDWYTKYPDEMQNFQSFMNEHNADDYLNLYNTEQKNFDIANKNNAEWHKDWYTKRAQLPQFKDVARQRLNSYSNLDSAKLIDPVNYAFKYWQADNASVFKDRNLPPETFYFPTNKLYGHQSDADKEILINSKLFNEGNYKINNKLYNQTITHEKNHEVEDQFPQKGTVNHLSKNDWKNLSSNFLNYFDVVGEPEKTNKDPYVDPIQRVISYDDILKDSRTEQGNDVYQYQPTEVRSRLDVWRQYNNIDPLKDYSEDEIRTIMQNNDKDPNVPRNIKELYKTIQETPNILRYLHNSYVSNDRQSPLDRFLPQNYIQKAQTGIQVMRPDATVTKSNLVQIDPSTKFSLPTPKFNDPYSELESLHNQSSKNYYDAFNSVNQWPKLSGKTIKLTTDRYRGANVPVEYIDMLKESAKKFKIDPYILYAIAGRESTFGQGSEENKERSRSPVDLVSGWNITEQYQPYGYDRFLADNKTPNIKEYKDKVGYSYSVDYDNIDNINNYIIKNNLVNRYKNKLEDTRNINYKNPFDFLSEFIVNKGIEKYNPGDPDYRNKINNEIRLLKMDPEFSRYANQKFGGLVKAQKGKQVYLSPEQLGSREVMQPSSTRVAPPAPKIQTSQYYAQAAKDVKNQNLTDEDFEKKYGTNKHTWQMKTDPNYRAQVEARAIESAKLNGTIDYPSSSIYSKSYTGNPWLNFMVPSGLKGEARAAYEQSQMDVVGAVLPIPGLQQVGKIPSIGKTLNNAGNFLTTKTPLRNAYKYNPWAFKPNPEAYYRQVGKPAIDDALSTKLIREKGEVVSAESFKNFNQQIKDLLGQGDYANYYEKAKAEALAKQHGPMPYFMKGELFYGNKNIIGGGAKSRGVFQNDKIPLDYLIESNHPSKAFQSSYAYRFSPVDVEEIGGVGVLKPNPSLRNLEDFNLYKKDWLRGYKQVDTPKQLPGSSNAFKSEIDWARWNKEIPENKALMQEYQAIEQEAKANGTWMKNPDGSPFVGTNPTAEELAFHNVNMTPEEAIKAQFIQQNSKKVKENMQYAIRNKDGSLQANYHNSNNKFDNFDDSTFGKATDDGWYGKGVYTSPSAKYTAPYGKNKYSFYINSKNPGIINKENIEAARYYQRNSDEIKQALNNDYAFLKSHNNITGVLNSPLSDIPAIIKSGGYKNFIKNKYPIELQKALASEGSLDHFTSLHNPYNNETITPFANYLKSAIGNNGMFDMTNPNIYKSILPAIGTGALGIGAVENYNNKKLKDGGTFNPSTDEFLGFID